MACEGGEEEPPRTNNPPQVAEIKVEPDPADARDDLVATVEVVDLDGDEVSIHGTNPLLRDTDRGGTADGREVELNSNPLDPSDD